MNLDQLLTFHAVAAVKSFQRAADTLHLTQPAVSKQVKALETELGEPLLERGRAIRLTHAGELLLKYAERIDQMVQAVTRPSNIKSTEGMMKTRRMLGNRTELSNIPFTSVPAP